MRVQLWKWHWNSVENILQNVIYWNKLKLPYASHSLSTCFPLFLVSIVSIIVKELLLLLLMRNRSGHKIAWWSSTTTSYNVEFSGCIQYSMVLYVFGTDLPTLFIKPILSSSLSVLFLFQERCLSFKYTNRAWARKTISTSDKNILLRTHFSFVEFLRQFWILINSATRKTFLP